VTHQRARIRAEIVSELKAAAIPGIGDKVFGSMFVPQREIPSIAVYPTAERMERVSGYLQRTAEFIVAAVVSVAWLAENDLDELCAGIEGALDYRLNGLAQAAYLTAVDFAAADDANSQTMTADHTLRVLYETPDRNAEG
jgi:hypothetical protein